jgi:hypothetical protein
MKKVELPINGLCVQEITDVHKGIKDLLDGPASLAIYYNQLKGQFLALQTEEELRVFRELETDLDDWEELKL